MAAKGPAWLKARHWISYQLAPRAQIFRRDAAAVVDLAGMQRIMRSNDYWHDKVSPLALARPQSLQSL